MNPLVEAFDTLASRRVLLFGGKGGVGKTTIATAAALHFARSRRTLLFTTDPAASITDLAGPDSGAASLDLEIEALEATVLYARFLEANLESFLEIGDRGTYLDREELRRLFELSLPGVDELMGWMRIGELAEAEPGRMLIVDTAPTGHTLRMLGSSEHFRQLAAALDAMQEKHRALIRQFARREPRDSFDEFIERLEAEALRRKQTLEDSQTTAFVPVTLADPLVAEQTIRLIGELKSARIDVPLIVLNRAVALADCEQERRQMVLDATLRRRLAPARVFDAPRACVPLDSLRTIKEWLQGSGGHEPVEPLVVPGPAKPLLLRDTRLLFVAGKGGVGKTSCAASIALQLGRARPDETIVVISVDPAHSLPRLMESVELPSNLSVEHVDTRAAWERFRQSAGERVSRAIGSLTPGGVSLGLDEEALRSLLEIAPPGADEIFAINRLAELLRDPSVHRIVVDTAPTGHFLRLLDLPVTAGGWVRELMRIVLQYRDLMRGTPFGEELLRASRALKELDATLHSDAAGVLVVTRPERIVVAETKRLLDDVAGRGIPLAGVVANYVTPLNDCSCDLRMRAHEMKALSGLQPDLVIERLDSPPMDAAALEGLVRLA